jgi:putative endonuclease
MTAERRARGIAGEDVAAAWYLSKGYEVLERNWRCRQGELDLIVRTGATVVFCEVKSRATTMFGTPAEAVTYDKRQRIRHLAARWIQDSKFRPAQIRFDVAAVLGDELEVIEGAF